MRTSDDKRERAQRLAGPPWTSELFGRKAKAEIPAYRQAGLPLRNKTKTRFDLVFL